MKKVQKKIFSIFLCIILAVSTCLTNSNFAVHAANLQENNPLVTMDGASIRIDGEQGLRFKVTVRNAGKALDYGIDVKCNGKTIRISYQNGYRLLYSFDKDSDTIEYTAVVTGFQKEQFDQEIEAVGFVAYEQQGSRVELNTNRITRSIQQVADLAGYVYNEPDSKWVPKSEVPTTGENETTAGEETTLAEQPTSEEATTAEETTEPEQPTSEEATTVEETTESEQPTSEEETTQAEQPTSEEETTQAEQPTSEEATTVEETTEPEQPTSEETTTAEETTEPEQPTSEETTTAEETTELEQPTSEETTTAEETTEAEQPTSEETTTSGEATTEQPTTSQGTDAEIEEVAGYRIVKNMMSEGTSLMENADGSLTVSFTDSYDAVYIALPEGKTAADYFSISVDLMSAEQFGFALTDKNGNNLKTSYPAYTVTYNTRDEYVLTFDALDNDVTAPITDGVYIRLMTLKNASYGNPAQHTPITIYGITFRERQNSQIEGKTLLDAYKDIFGYVGNAGDLAQLKNPTTLDYYKQEYNSFTLGNEMKPDYILRKNGTKTLVSTAEAKEKYGYDIPEGYTEDTVPELYFDVMDETLKIASENGIKMRGHTLVWHSQTPTWFFKEGYSDDGAFVSPEVMNERVKFYVKNVMKHVYDGEYSDVIYAWDVTNEYLHQGTDPNKSGWVGVYGDEIVQNGKIVTNPEYVKIAFSTANQVLTEKGMRDQVHLFYNDYNTYGVVTECCELIDFLNAKDEKWNPEGKTLCDGIGMQSHLDVMWPTVQQYLKALDTFASKGYEIQITELDVTLNMLGNQNTEEERLAYWKELMEGLVAAKKNGANITAFVIWGMYDDISWRKQYTPLLFSHSFYEKKEAYDIVIKAAETY